MATRWERCCSLSIRALAERHGVHRRAVRQRSCRRWRLLRRAPSGKAPAALIAGQPCMRVGGAPRGRERAAWCTHASLGGQPHEASIGRGACSEHEREHRDDADSEKFRPPTLAQCAHRASVGGRAHDSTGYRDGTIREVRSTVHRISSSSKSGAAGGRRRPVIAGSAPAMTPEYASGAVSARPLRGGQGAPGVPSTAS